MKSDMLLLQSFEVEKLNLEGGEIIAYALLYQASMFGKVLIPNDAFDRLCIGIQEWIDALCPPHSDYDYDAEYYIDRLMAMGFVVKYHEGVMINHDTEER